MRTSATTRYTTLWVAALWVLLPVATALAQRAGIVDRIVAVVNGEIVTLAQLNRAVRAAQEEPGDPTETCSAPADDTPSFETRVLECMIDNLLQFQHVRRFPQFDVLPEDIEAAYQGMVGQYESREAFEAELRRQQKTAAEVRYDLEREALIVNYINLRYRDVVDVRETEMRRYYDEVLRPEMVLQDAELPPFEAVDDEFLRPMLVEMEVNRRVGEWIADLRRRADIIVNVW